MEGDYHGRPRWAARDAAVGLTLSRYDPAQVIDLHRHKTAYLCVVLAGAFNEVSDGMNDACRAGSVVVHPAGEAHANRFAPRPAVCLNVTVANEALDGVGRSVLHDSIVTVAVLRVLSHVSASDRGALHAVADLRWAIEVETHRGDRPSWLGDVRARIERGASTRTVAELAREAGVHPSHLLRVFASQYRVRLGRFLKLRRVARSVSLIATGELPLTDIAFESGFADQSHMTNVLRAETGMTPTSIRRLAAL